MKRKWKAIIIVAVVAALAIGVYASTVYSKRGVVAVQTGKVVRGDLTSLVTASGEIKPKNYINIGANAIGVLSQILVKEGDHVRKGQLVARVENIQPEAQVNSQKPQSAPPKQIPTRPRPRSRLAMKICAPSRPSSTIPRPISITPSSTTIAPRSFTRTNFSPSKTSTPEKRLLTAPRPLCSSNKHGSIRPGPNVSSRRRNWHPPNGVWLRRRLRSRRLPTCFTSMTRTRRSMA